jgi:hypothetical protein
MAQNIQYQKAVNVNLMQVLNPARVDTFVPPNVYLTPEALMTYCQTRLSELDTQIKAAFAEQQRAQKAGRCLREALSCVGNCAAYGFKTQDGHAGVDMIGNLQCQINQVGENTPEGKRLKELQLTIASEIDPSNNLRNLLAGDPNVAYAQYWSRVGPSGDLQGKTDQEVIKGLNFPDPGGRQIDGKRVQQWVEDLKGIQADINAGTELGMIQLQSIMSQRQTALQLTTNLVQALGDQMKQIAANIGK